MPQCCGTCKWWEHDPYWQDEGHGSCKAPLPVAIQYPYSKDMFEDEGEDCGCYQKVDND